MDLGSLLDELPIVDRESYQGPAPEEADESGGEDDPGDGEERPGGDCDD